MSENDREEERTLLTGLKRFGVALTLPLFGAALLWWLPRSVVQIRWVSLGVIVVALAGWYYWRDES